MKMNMYVVYDKVAEQSMPIFESRNDGTAWRAYQKSIIEADDIPQDEMKLICIGSINHDTLVVELEEAPREVEISFEFAEEK